ncbi:DUF4181 domain-containing protein [Oceanobacillus kapialis]|uniref:DUF4181 domain-containing protein n=1 Tax=Oceanobacillus kapialis TaxID=481353 RepID=A0ABW5Q2Y7_9BACI
MWTIFIILICILVLDHFINRRLIKKLPIERSTLENESKYVNKQHKYGENILYWSSYIVMLFSILEFPSLRIFIFIGVGLVFEFRTYMKWKFTREKKTYLLSAVTCGLFLIGSIVYALLDYTAIV